MPAQPDGDPAPPDGRLPEGLNWDRPLRAYLHVPFCSSRCGYCDFNTYTASELGGFDVAGYVRAMIAEMDLAAAVGRTKPLASVFIGGGTPSLLPPDELAALLSALRDRIGIEGGAEITMEANPENVDPQALEVWRAAGVNRLSLGMQSADPGALRVLQRVHTPGRAVQAAGEARAAGFEHVSLDLIYGVPGQSTDSWRQTVLSALSAEPDHVSAYALGVEDGTALARQIRRGEVPAPDPDLAVDQYEIADDVLSSHGFAWYEISNWARPGGTVRAQPRLLACGQLVGVRTGGTFPRGRHPVVERETPRHIPRDAGGRKQSRGRQGAAHRTGSACRIRDAAGADGRRFHRR